MKGGALKDGQKASKIVNKNSLIYWRATTARKGKRVQPQPIITIWNPMFGDLRVNFDVAFKDGNTITSCILRNSRVLSWVLGLVTFAQKIRFVQRRKRQSKHFIMRRNLV